MCVCVINLKLYHKVVYENGSDKFDMIKFV